MRTLALVRYAGTPTEEICSRFTGTASVTVQENLFRENISRENNKGKNKRLINEEASGVEYEPFRVRCRAEQLNMDMKGVQKIVECGKSVRIVVLRARWLLCALRCAYVNEG